ncbi:thioredoxin domain-containing protein [Candidatus Woesearchaeota archaeon]|nr:thioredoxin domain-containing protein [Candidatus Woesearchaeota archaeon]
MSKSEIYKRFATSQAVTALFVSSCYRHRCIMRDAHLLALIATMCTALKCASSFGVAQSLNNALVFFCVMKVKLKHLVALGILIIAAYLAYWYTIPSYPDIITPKPDFGNPDSPIKIIEFSDLQCPACAQAHPIAIQLLEEYGDDISFQFYHFPLRSIHAYAQKAAEGAECANDQGMMKEYIDAAFKNNNRLSTSDLKLYASALGMDDTFNDCLDSGAKAALVESDYRVGISKGVKATPTFFINDEKVEQVTLQSLRTRIEMLLASANA